MGSGLAAVAGDGLPIHADEPSGLADTVALGDVMEDRDGLLRRQVGAEQRGAFALGEAGLAGPAAEHAAGLAGAVAMGDGEVSRPPLTVLGAVGIQAAEACEVVHGRGPEPNRSAGLPVALPDLHTGAVGAMQQIPATRELCIAKCWRSRTRGRPPGTFQRGSLSTHWGHLLCSARRAWDLRSAGQRLRPP